MDVLEPATLILQWDMQSLLFNSSCTNHSDTFVPYNNIQTLWRVINDFDIVTRVPVTPCTLFNGGAGDENDLLMAKGVIKVHLSIRFHASYLTSASIHVGLLRHRDRHSHLQEPFGSP